MDVSSTPTRVKCHKPENALYSELLGEVPRSAANLRKEPL